MPSSSSSAASSSSSASARLLCTNSRSGQATERRTSHGAERPLPAPSSCPYSPTPPLSMPARNANVRSHAMVGGRASFFFPFTFGFVRCYPRWTAPPNYFFTVAEKKEEFIILRSNRRIAVVFAIVAVGSNCRIHGHCNDVRVSRGSAPHPPLPVISASFELLSCPLPVTFDR